MDIHRSNFMYFSGSFFWYNEPTNAQLIDKFIILLLHVSTLLFFLQGARSQYLLNYISMSMQSWWYNLKFQNEDDTMVSKHVGAV